MRVRMRGMHVRMFWGAQEEVVQAVWRAAAAPRERRHRQYVYSCTGKASKLSTEQGKASKPTSEATTCSAPAVR